MENERLANVPVVTKFVREVIGCDCPDEIFRRVEVRAGSTAVKSCPADCELRIGGRLLVVVTSEPVEALSGSRLERVILEGKQARDQGQFNRFRLGCRRGMWLKTRLSCCGRLRMFPARMRRRMCT